MSFLLSFLICCLALSSLISIGIIMLRIDSQNATRSALHVGILYPPLVLEMMTFSSRIFEMYI